MDPKISVIMRLQCIIGGFIPAAPTANQTFDNQFKSIAIMMSICVNRIR